MYAEDTCAAAHTAHSENHKTGDEGMTEDTQTQRTTWTLANLAGCAGPDRPDNIGWDHDAQPAGGPSPGADFLRSVESSTLEAIEYGWNEDAAHEVADGSVPVYTGELWSVFVDVAAWTEDPSELGYGAGGWNDADMTTLAGACLYLIARRLAEAIADEADTDDEDDEDVPADFPVRPLLTAEDKAGAASLATCGHCGRSWDDGIITSMTPTPSARCPFEYYHGTGAA